MVHQLHTDQHHYHQASICSTVEFDKTIEEDLQKIIQYSNTNFGFVNTMGDTMHVYTVISECAVDIILAFHTQVSIISAIYSDYRGNNLINSYVQKTIILCYYTKRNSTGSGNNSVTLGWNAIAMHSTLQQSVGYNKLYSAVFS